VLWKLKGDHILGNHSEGGREDRGIQLLVLCSDCFLIFTKLFRCYLVVLQKLCHEISVSFKGPPCQHAAVKEAHPVVLLFTHADTIFCFVPCPASCSSIWLRLGVIFDQESFLLTRGDDGAFVPRETGELLCVYGQSICGVRYDAN